ncbi:MAG TPA: sigma-54 dependent transcriptional regulator [Planctomycetota bacterium]|nr:sigma-54 dependent transcriptional regulator [Planctomycetota bacterium]HRR82977.1 sigma-54 dependent transcriptional regulator [Planctomycetota bacterium]HRT94600.1 sigma-54 dependent transcriptional regulator [Planctomycetota bacterium]
MAKPKPSILIVEDDESMQDFLTTFLEQEGYEVQWAPHGGIARQRLDARPIDVVLTDILMPEVDGVEVLDYVRARYPDTAVIVMTGHSSVRQAVDLIRRGADDYFKKPFDVDEMLHVIRRSIEHRRMQREARTAAPPAAPGGASPRELFPNIIGQSSSMLPIFDLILKVADTHSTVLIQGSSGTGKELVATAIHEKSSRRSGPFIPVHCGAIPETLLESELFGHEKGSFTGAIARKEGVFKLADHGTLFLDEVSEMSVPLQVKLLRVLETGSFRRVGGVEDLRVDVRVVAATNRNLKDLVDKNLFRHDLFYRLNVFPIFLPPLRERAADIPVLVQHFLQKLARSGRPSCTASREALSLLCSYEWPGNVRELENVIERAVILCGGGEVRPEHLPQELLPRKPGAVPPPEATDLPFRAAKTIFEKQYVQTFLARYEGNVAAAAKAAGMSRAHFYELLKKHHIDFGRHQDD